jgi:hypothetical protein
VLAVGAVPSLDRGRVTRSRHRRRLHRHLRQQANGQSYPEPHPRLRLVPDLSRLVAFTTRFNRAQLGATGYR